MKFVDEGTGAPGGLRGKRGGAIPGAEAGEDPFDEELVAAAEPGFDPQAFGGHA